MFTIFGPRGREPQNGYKPSSKVEHISNLFTVDMICKFLAAKLGA